MVLRADQVRRYARHILLPDVGGRGQERLLAASAVVEPAVGAGEMALLYLAACGLGTLIVPDRRPVDRPGLLYETSDLGRSRSDAARDRLRALNPDVEVTAASDRPDPWRLVLPDPDPTDPVGTGARAAARLIREILR